MQILYQPLAQRREDDSTHFASTENGNVIVNPVLEDVEESKQQTITPFEVDSNLSQRNHQGDRRMQNVVNLHDSIIARNDLIRERNMKNIWIFLFFSLIIALGLFYSLSPTSMEFVGDDYHSEDDKNSGSKPTMKKSFNVSTLAFGSCSSYDLRDMNIFTDAILPSHPKPDAWIWAGDMVYLDESDLNCYIFENTPDWQRTCNCTPNWYQTTPAGCHSSDVEYAQRRWMKGLENEPYNEFLSYMCPKSMVQGIFPPDGSDPNLCDHPIFGIYDDHDFGWNNGNEREINKRVFKNLFLDAIGEPMTSIRRNENRGAWYTYHLNEDQPVSKHIDIIMLDERYEREMIPCDTRRDYCEKIVFQQSNANSTVHRIQPHATSANEVAWCKDFLYGGPYLQGTCCKKDEDIFFGWCLQSNHRSHQYYRDVCDVTYEHFGMKSLIYDAVHDDIISPEFLKNDKIDESQVSPFCEVLGKQQRRWLRTSLPTLTAPVKLFVSGSVLLYDPSWHSCGQYSITYPNGTESIEEVKCRCGGDNLDCYRVAQRELLHLISEVKGCAIVLTGDYHFSDIKVLKNGLQIYSTFDYYDSYYNKQSIYQLMSSGLSSSTARNVSCEDYRLDPMGLRTHSECSFVRGANFGKIIFEYEEKKNEELKRIILQILSGTVANKVLLETIIDPLTCTPTS